ncbi:hypothetical protein JL720_1019 [Aureococcus anophagefferens]|nr:hypothetical protein JL720_1019 [Aureococcus anophagefferens]
MPAGGFARRGLRERFDEYSAFGGTNAGQGLTNKNFAKLAKDCALLDKRLTLTTLDLIFAKCIDRGAKKLQWPQFLEALKQCASTKRVAVEKVHEVVAGSEGPRLTATTARRRRAPRRPDDDTGVHVAGGPTIIDNKLTLDSLADRSEADVRGVKKNVDYANANAGLGAGQESEMPNFKGSDLGRFPLVSADFWTSDHLSERSPRLAAPPPNYFDLLTRYFMKHNPSKASNVGVLLTQYAGHEQELFDKMEAKYGDPVVPRAGRNAGHGAAAPPKGNIYDKLCDTSLYTGAHKQRFDETGQGRGLAGRDFTAKGGIAGRSTTHHGFQGDTNTKTDTGTSFAELAGSTLGSAGTYQA